MAKPKTGLQGKLSHDLIRYSAWRQLDEKYGQEAGSDYSKWPSIADVYDGFVLANLYVNGAYGLYKVPYTVGAGDELSLGEPVSLLDDAQQAGKMGTMRVQASAKVLTGSDATQLLNDLKDKNPLFASLDDSPNTHLVVFDLTSVGRPSNHQGPMKYQLSKRGLASAIPTLISKPIHITSDFEGHFAQGQPAKPIGAFLGSMGIEEPDGTITLRAIGTLWEDDFPEEVKEIGERIAELGASYEITYPPETAVRLNASVTEIGSYKFSGGAILKKSAAAHPTTQLLVANNGVNEEDYALFRIIEGRKIYRFPITDAPSRMLAFSQLDSSGLTAEELQKARNAIIARAMRDGDSWLSVSTMSFPGLTTATNGGSFHFSMNANSLTPKEGRTMTMSTKYPGGILAEHDTAVSAIVASALASMLSALADPNVSDFQYAEMSEETKKKFKENQKAMAELPALREKASQHEGFVAKVAELNTELTATKAKIAEFEPQMAELTTLRAEKAEADKVAGMDTLWAKLKAQYGLKDDQRASKQPVLDKMYAGQTVTVEDVILLTTGATATAGTPAPTVPLMAGVTTPTPAGTVVPPDPEALKRNFPALATGPRFK